MHFFRIFPQNNLVVSEKSSTFALAFGIKVAPTERPALIKATCASALPTRTSSRVGPK